MSAARPRRGRSIEANLRPISEERRRGSSGTWQQQLPVLDGERVILRELRMSDASSLHAMLTTAEVTRFISTPPSTVEGFEQFIARSRGQQAAGKLACFAVTLKGHDTAIGVYQIREMEPGFATAELGFAIGSPFWGTGIFEESAHLVLAFAFNHLGVHRLEARAAVRNGRGNRALRKLGAVQEGLLRQALLCGGQHLDQVLYGIVEDDWRAARRAKPALVH